MEHLTIRIDDGTGSEFDRLLQESRDNGLQDSGDLIVATKNICTESGRAGVLLTFTVENPPKSGKLQRVQTVVTMRLFRAVCQAILANYTEDGTKY